MILSSNVIEYNLGKQVYQCIAFRKKWKDIENRLATTLIQGKVILNVGDRNGKFFTYILEYFRTNTLPDNVMKDETLRQSLFIEAHYLGLKNFTDQLIDICFPDRTLLKLAHKRKLNEFYGKVNQRWDLIYKVTRDGLDADAFHSRCNNRGPNMTIIQSNINFLFGGYTAIS
ncbi:unnamed protein product [Rotaria magnacalcarata]|uniref:TLDc domain-containing protein n=4 Tax=Rotaria magnacalcarata TaxID=392030 RepID=A0A816AN58_9BILA|nr:unnamed protein product [Rotaria magnacalcarata]CAF4467271.1 unnamed protein product [Rotaria magnacalcarata]CAF4578975.1 unnamed protein product [Rotaria magnacalcarata]